jgi:hypothetical protein
VFAKGTKGWKLAARLKSSDLSDLDALGGSVAASGSMIAVGAYGHDHAAGGVYLFTKSAAGWKQVAELKGSDTSSGDEFGDAVCLSGDLMVAGAPDHDHFVGRAYVFQA